MHKFLENIGEPVNTFIIPFVFVDKIKEAVQSIWKNHSNQDHRLILIDNSDEEFKDKKYLEENSHFYIKCYRNIGPAMAYNIGVKMAHTKYVTIMSDDARIIYSCWYDQSIKLINNTDTIVSLNSIYQHRVLADDFYSPYVNYSQIDYQRLDQMYGMKRELFGLALAIGKRDTFIKSGLFPEDKYIYWLDGRFADQARKQGVSCVGSGIVFHYGDASHKGRLVEKNKYYETITKEGITNL